MTRLRVAHAATVLAFGLVLVLTPAAFAGKPSKPAAGGGTGSSLTFSLLDSPDALPNFGENLKFTVNTSAARPYVNLKCYQGGDWVTNQTVGFYAGYPWSQVFPLSSWKWTSGAADCTARLYTSTSKRTTTLATLSFHVYA
jgi:hypothetical protein